ncbi:MAG: hypothetical protein K0S51_1186 [Bacillales bacterium]|jgi:hypothetical protein|nr:hypothetical protein [Bacillales bacterium]
MIRLNLFIIPIFAILSIYYKEYGYTFITILMLLILFTVDYLKDKKIDKIAILILWLFIINLNPVYYLAASIAEYTAKTSLIINTIYILINIIANIYIDRINMILKKSL